MNEGGEVSLSLTTLVVMAQTILLIFKFSGVIKWPWICVFSPVLLTLGIYGLAIVLIILIAHKGDK